MKSFKKREREREMKFDFIVEKIGTTAGSEVCSAWKLLNCGSSLISINFQDSTQKSTLPGGPKLPPGASVASQDKGALVLTILYWKSAVYLVSLLFCKQGVLFPNSTCSY